MDNDALVIIRDYIINDLTKTRFDCFVPQIDFDVYIVWKCKTLQNWKYLLSTTIPDGMYYELTYNGDTKEWYLDAYQKIQNKVITKE